MHRRSQFLVVVLVVVVAAACSSASPETSTTAATSTLAPTSTTDAPAPSTTDPQASTTTAAPGEAPDLVLHGGQVITVDDDFSIVRAVAVTDGVFSAVGADDEVMQLAGPDTIVVDLGGRTVMPGIVDPHTHQMQVVAPDQGAMLAAQAHMLSLGTTTSGAPSVGPDHLAAFEALNERGALVQRVHVYLNYNGPCDQREDTGFFPGRQFTQDPDLRLAIAGVKLFGDGGACGAPAYSDEYLDTTPQELKDRGFVEHGTLFTSADEVSEVVTAVDAAGGITVIHAIGDLALREALTGLANAWEVKPFDHHQRIDHNSFTTMLTPAELSIYGLVGMAPVVFTIPWGNGCSPDVAARWKSLLPPAFFTATNDSAALRAANPDMRIAWHGDAPFIPGDPFDLMFTLVTAGTVDLETGEPCYPDPWQSWHTVDVEEAIRMMTINAAAAMEIDHAVGSIELGKAADLVVLANDILGTDPEIAIAANQVTVTMIDGAVHHCVDALCDQFNSTGGDGPDPGTCAVPPDDLESWWTGDADAVDLVGGNHGDMINGTRNGPGLVGGALKLSQSAVSLPGQPNLAGGFTIEGWVYLDGPPAFDRFQTVFNNNQVFIRKNNPEEDGGFSVFVKLDDGSVEPRAQAFTPANPETWTHVAATWDQQTLSLYLNGELASTSPRTGALIGTSVEARIGSGEQEGLDGNELSGLIDELTIYSRALDGSEIAVIHAAGSAGKCRP